MSSYYDHKYHSTDRYWGKEPTSLARKVVEMSNQADKPRLIEIGCGEGRDVIFFAQNGFKVTAFDLSAEGVRKTREWTEELRISADVFKADINTYHLDEPFDVVFSSGTLQYIPIDLRKAIIANYKAFTNTGGINAHTVPVYKPFILQEADSDPMERRWLSGELLTHYHDWLIEYFSEEILDIASNGQFAVNRMIARNPLARSSKPRS